MSGHHHGGHGGRGRGWGGGYPVYATPVIVCDPLYDPTCPYYGVVGGEEGLKHEELVEPAELARRYSR